VLFLCPDIGMSQFNDPCEGYPLTIDVGGQLYYLGSEKPVELAYKSRDDFFKDFEKDFKDECLLRKYLFVSLKGKKRLRFDSPEEKQKLIQILKTRAGKIKQSQEFTSSVLKNTMLQRSYVGIQNLIAEFEGPEHKGFLNDIELPGMPEVFGCEKTKKAIKEIKSDKRNDLILAMAYFFLNPDRVPKDVECDWANLVKKMDTLNLGDIMETISKLKSQSGGPETPMNAFRQLGLQGGGGPVIKTALDEFKELALKVRGDSAKKNIEERIKSLLTVTEIQKNLARPIASSQFSSDIITGADAEKLSALDKKRGGGNNESIVLEKPLGNAMRPLYDYFKVVYDPVYSFLESVVMRNGPDMKTVLLPQLLSLLYICNSIKPQETTDGGAMSYGVYRITNVSEEVLAFVNNMLGATESQLMELSEDKDKRTFTLQLSSLPKVRLSSILNTGTILYKESDTIPNIQFFTVNNNLTLPKEDDFIYEGGKEVVYKALTELFNERDLYIVCSKSKDFSTTPTNVPMNVYEVNFDEINVDSETFKYTIPDTYFNQKKNQDVGAELLLDKLVKLKDYVIYNDAELALSIFMALKLTLPK